ncbi:MBL fold metallo-hydrolase [Kibdelosporangium phytohabitans]|uniref:MBL fold metallo-hydrolase n=1 Tax=Kibdelosporangium phytohabitans TaxID=860235 RepID=A0A0N9IBR4_9PSEU|nr:MBL fold metallo-hydrolase [Kibdelosporangium phytohabitans]ALG11933.1 MBL fold metallo-hydrolase [Kibdelosporangium phytohabitans]MBE1463387.1 glyoxylase-like metal-dependent hydrolase (beta-lactamase superfamily II) [Kibdelosporangium phytohabitans]
MSRPASRAQVRIGDTTVTYLPDGHAWLNPAVFFPSSDWATHAAHLDERGWFPVSIGSFLVRTPDRAVLVDLGLGPVEFTLPDTAEFRGGGLIDALAAENLAPGDVDTVVYTHLHHDHVGWTTTAGAGLTFPNARHLVSKAEWTHWWGTAELVGPDPEGVQQPLADVIGFVDNGDTIAPGVRVLATPGHTPGHNSIEVTGDDQRRVVILGDVMHCQVQVTESHWSFAFDVDPAAGVDTRKRLLDELADGRTVLAGGHFAGEVFGRVLPPALRRAWASGPDIA